MARFNPTVRLTAFAILVGLPVAIAGCSPSAVVDQLPGGMGLPADAPARPRTPYKYPAVHDMPPPRSSTPLSEGEQVRLEKELQAARDRLAGKSGSAPQPAPAGRKPASAARNQPLDIKSGQASGTAPKP